MKQEGKILGKTTTGMFTLKCLKLFVMWGWGAEGIEEESIKKLAYWQAAAPHKQLDEAEIKICFQLKGRV